MLHRSRKAKASALTLQLCKIHSVRAETMSRVSQYCDQDYILRETHSASETDCHIVFKYVFFVMKYHLKVKSFLIMISVAQ